MRSQSRKPHNLYFHVEQVFVYYNMYVFICWSTFTIITTFDTSCCSAIRCKNWTNQCHDWSLTMAQCCNLPRWLWIALVADHSRWIWFIISSIASKTFVRVTSDPELSVGFDESWPSLFWLLACACTTVTNPHIDKATHAPTNVEDRLLELEFYKHKQMCHFTKKSSVQSTED